MGGTGFWTWTLTPSLYPFPLHVGIFFTVRFFAQRLLVEVCINVISNRSKVRIIHIQHPAPLCTHHIKTSVRRCVDNCTYFLLVAQVWQEANSWFRLRTKTFPPTYSYVLVLGMLCLTRNSRFGHNKEVILVILIKKSPPLSHLPVAVSKTFTCW